jgi:hypothetical protein
MYPIKKLAEPYQKGNKLQGEICQIQICDEHFSIIFQTKSCSFSHPSQIYLFEYYLIKELLPFGVLKIQVSRPTFQVHRS